MRIRGNALTEINISDILEPSFTIVEFRSIYNQQKDQREYQYKPFGQWETYLVVPGEFYARGGKVAQYIVLEHHIPKYFAQERYYKVERIN